MKLLKNKLLWSAVVIFVLIYGISIWYIGSRVYVDNKTKSDAIIILGAKVMKGNSYNPCLQARVSHAVTLYKKGYGKKIIVTGGIDKETQKSEALGMKTLAKNEGIEEKNILLESKSTSTYENLVFSKDLMKKHNITSVIIVTEPFHSPRADLVATKLGITHTMSPTKTSPCWNRWTFLSRYFLREPIALLEYLVRGKI